MEAKGKVSRIKVRWIERFLASYVREALAGELARLRRENRALEQEGDVLRAELAGMRYALRHSPRTIEIGRGER